MSILHFYLIMFDDYGSNWTLYRSVFFQPVSYSQQFERDMPVAISALSEGMIVDSPHAAFDRGVVPPALSEGIVVSSDSLT